MRYCAVMICVVRNDFYAECEIVNGVWGLGLVYKTKRLECFAMDRIGYLVISILGKWIKKQVLMCQERDA